MSPNLSASDAAELFRHPPHRFIDVGAGEVAVRTVGTGPDVVFVHGWPASGATFRSLLPHLVDRVTCHVVDLPGAGSSRFDASTPITFERHVETVRRVVEQLADGTARADVADPGRVAVVAHDSGGMIARHAVAGHPAVRALGLIDTEQPQGMSWRFRSFVAVRHVPGIGPVFRRLAGSRRLRRNRFVFGDVFVDRSLLDGEFDEFFLRPLCDDAARLDAAMRLLKSFDARFVEELGALHRRIDVPVQLVWGARDPFFPVEGAREMVATFPRARLTVVPDASVFSHEERPAEVAEALLPVLTGDWP